MSVHLLYIPHLSEVAIQHSLHVESLHESGTIRRLDLLSLKPPIHLNLRTRLFPPSLTHTSLHQPSYRPWWLGALSLSFTTTTSSLVLYIPSTFPCRPNPPSHHDNPLSITPPNQPQHPYTSSHSKPLPRVTPTPPWPGAQIKTGTGPNTMRMRVLHHDRFLRHQY